MLSYYKDKRTCFSRNLQFTQGKSGLNVDCTDQRMHLFKAWYPFAWPDCFVKDITFNALRVKDDEA